MMKSNAEMSKAYKKKLKLTKIWITKLLLRMLDWTEAPVCLYCHHDPEGECHYSCYQKFLHYNLWGRCTFNKYLIKIFGEKLKTLVELFKTLVNTFLLKLKRVDFFLLFAGQSSGFQSKATLLLSSANNCCGFYFLSVPVTISVYTPTVLALEHTYNLLFPEGGIQQCE